MNAQSIPSDNDNRTPFDLKRNCITLMKNTIRKEEKIPSIKLYRKVYRQEYPLSIKKFKTYIEELIMAGFIVEKTGDLYWSEEEISFDGKNNGDSNEKTL